MPAADGGDLSSVGLDELAGRLAQLRFEELVGALEDLTRRMSSGEVGIEEATELYERAGIVQRAAAERLERVRERIEKVTGEGGAPGGAEAGT